MFETSNKLNKILLKGLNSRIYKIEGLGTRLVQGFQEGLIPVFTQS